MAPKGKTGNAAGNTNKLQNGSKGIKPRGGTGQKDREIKPPQGGKGNNTDVVLKPIIIKPAPTKTVTSQPGNVIPKFPPPGTQLTDTKKWCVKNISLRQPVIEKRSFDTGVLISTSKDESAYSLLANTIVNVLKPKIGDPSGWSAVTYKKTEYESSLKDWITTEVSGWVKDVYLDNYNEHENKQFQQPVVTIPHPTKDSTDAQQYMTIEDENHDESKARANMCGQLSIAFVAQKDIDTVLREWKAKSPGYYNSMVGRGNDEPLERVHMEDILNVQGITFERYKVEIKEKGKKPRVEKIPLADGKDPRRASDDMQKKLEDYYFITNLKIDTNTGDLVPASKAEERNHWVVVDRITRDGSHVELYNPFPNKYQEYSFGEFYRSVGGDPNSGWWLKRSSGQTRGGKDSRGNGKGLLEIPKTVIPDFKVRLEVPKRDGDTAEQYVWIGGKKKTNLCGEFCVAYIVGDSMVNALKRWNEKKKPEPAGLWELSTILKAYGYRDGAVRPFSIITLLEYWKLVQPKLYGYHVDENKGTGTRELSTILKAYGYTNLGDLTGYRAGLTDESTKEFLPSPGRIKSKLETHYLIAGVGINNKSGKLIKGSTTRHWVVLENITPVGNLVGGNGGWVELYNPFTNIMEEYSVREFANSMNSETGLWGDDGLWVTRDMEPKFMKQTVADPLPEVKDTRPVIKNVGKGGNKEGGNKRGGNVGGTKGGKDGNTKGGNKRGGNVAGQKDNKVGGKNHGR